MSAIGSRAAVAPGGIAARIEPAGRRSGAIVPARFFGLPLFAAIERRRRDATGVRIARRGCAVQPCTAAGGFGAGDGRGEAD